MKISPRYEVHARDNRLFQMFSLFTVESLNLSVMLSVSVFSGIDSTENRIYPFSNVSQSPHLAINYIPNLTLTQS